MFASIMLNPAWPTSRPLIIGSGGTATWGELADRVAALERDLPKRVPAGQRVGLVFRVDTTSLAALAVLDRLACDTFILDGMLAPEPAAWLGAELGLGLVLVPSGSSLEALVLPATDKRPGSTRSTVTILTSGTTGRPKPVGHTWASLNRPVRVHADDPAPRWLLTYRPHLYAGLQVVLQSLVNGGTLVVPEPDATPQAVAELMSTAEVAYASATPSYWRRLLLFAEPEVLRRVPLRQITLGGEVVDQPILDALRQVFPRARIVHIYATTELGRCFAVTDGKAGFPARLLREPTPDGGELWLEDGELVARSANAMQAYVDGFGTPLVGGGHRTGDLVEVVGDRAYFVGRRTDLINVGGNKVAPLEVEGVIRRVPGVAEAKVHSRRSSIAGELVACQVVAAAGSDAATVEAAIVRVCLSELAGFQRPRLIEFVPEIALDGSGKLNRRPES